jgi:hypothetical protein
VLGKARGVAPGWSNRRAGRAVRAAPFPNKLFPPLIGKELHGMWAPRWGPQATAWWRQSSSAATTNSSSLSTPFFATLGQNHGPAQSAASGSATSRTIRTPSLPSAAPLVAHGVSAPLTIPATLRGAWDAEQTAATAAGALSTGTSSSSGDSAGTPHEVSPSRLSEAKSGGCPSCLLQDAMRSERIYALCRHNQRRLETVTQQLETLLAHTKELQLAIAELKARDHEVHLHNHTKHASCQTDQNHLQPDHRAQASIELEGHVVQAADKHVPSDNRVPAPDIKLETGNATNPNPPKQNDEKIIQDEARDDKTLAHEDARHDRTGSTASDSACRSGNHSDINNAATPPRSQPLDIASGNVEVQTCAGSPFLLVDDRAVYFASTG